MNAVGEKEAWEEVERAVNNVAKKKMRDYWWYPPILPPPWLAER